MPSERVVWGKRGFTYTATVSEKEKGNISEFSSCMKLLWTVPILKSGFEGGMLRRMIGTQISSEKVAL